jgi:lambda family phage minor tail protein L
MKSLSNNLIDEKNKLENLSPWITLYEVELNDSETIYLAEYPENITFDSNTYISFPIKHSDFNENSRGTIARMQVTVANADRQIQAYLEANNGLRGQKVIVRMVHKDHLDDPTSVIESTLYIIAPSFDGEAVVFTLSPTKFDILRVQTPGRAYLRICTWQYKQEGCWLGNVDDGLTQSNGFQDHAPGENCPRTLAACKLRNNLLRFGGFPGIPRGYVNAY